MKHKPRADLSHPDEGGLPRTGPAAAGCRVPPGQTPSLSVRLAGAAHGGSLLGTPASPCPPLGTAGPLHGMRTSDKGVFTNQV